MRKHLAPWDSSLGAFFIDGAKLRGLKTMPGISINWDNFDPTKPLAVDLTSECVESTHYNPATFTLTIYFQEGQTYEYYDVPPYTVYSLVQSASPGRYFNAAIRDVFAYEEV